MRVPMPALVGMGLFLYINVLRAARLYYFVPWRYSVGKEDAFSCCGIEKK